jgi:hypothetical protein
MHIEYAVAATFIVLILTVGGCVGATEARQAKAKAEMVKAGYTPLQARCAFTGSSYDAVCLVHAAK